jgi:S1-C subfamily serine protease
MELFRAGKREPISLKPVEYPPSFADELSWRRLGVRVRASRRAMRITAVRPRSEAAQIGINPGDYIVRVNNQPVGSLDAYREALLSARNANSVVVLLQRGNVGYHLSLPF